MAVKVLPVKLARPAPKGLPEETEQTVSREKTGHKGHPGADGPPGPVNITDNLTSTAADAALSANQGRVLNNLVNSMNYVANAVYDKPSGYLTFTFKDGQTLAVNIPIAELISNIGYDSSTKEIVLSQLDGTEIRIDVSDLIDEYVGSTGTHIQISIESGNTITAVLRNDTVTGQQLVSDIALRGNPTATTQAAGDNSTRIATTAHVKSQVIDSLTSTVTNRPLSANQGRALNEGKAENSALISHTGDTGNPHNVTAAQLGTGFATTTASADATDKNISLPGFNVPQSGGALYVRFTNGSTHTNPNLRVNGFSMGVIQFNNGPLPNGAIPEGHVAMLVYDGFDWQLINPWALGYGY